MNSTAVQLKKKPARLVTTKHPAREEGQGAQGAGRGDGGGVRAGKHGSALVAGFGGGGANQLRGQVLASDGGLNSVDDPRRQNIGPLVHGLVGDANGFGGSGHSPAEQFNGFGLLHSPIEPQFKAWRNLSSFVVWDN